MLSTSLLLVNCMACRTQKCQSFGSTSSIPTFQRPGPVLELELNGVSSKRHACMQLECGLKRLKLNEAFVPLHNTCTLKMCCAKTSMEESKHDKPQRQTRLTKEQQTRDVVSRQMLCYLPTLVLTSLSAKLNDAFVPLRNAHSKDASCCCCRLSMEESKHNKTQRRQTVLTQK
jgi:hypothetical protein